MNSMVLSSWRLFYCASSWADVLATWPGLKPTDSHANSCKQLDVQVGYNCKSLDAVRPSPGEPECEVSFLQTDRHKGSLDRRSGHHR